MAKKLTDEEVSFMRKLAENVRGQPSYKGIATYAVADALKSMVDMHATTPFTKDQVKKVLEEVSQIALQAKTTLDQP